MAMRDLIPRRGRSDVEGYQGEQQFRDPFLTLHHQIQRAFDDIWNGFGTPMALEPTGRLPAMDVRETENGYELSVDLPGFDEKDIDLRLDDNVLRITAQTSADHEEKRKGYIYSERRQGAVTRAIQLPDGVDAENVSANYQNGVLTVQVGKSQTKTASKRIPLSGGGSQQKQTASSAGKGETHLQQAAQQPKTQSQQQQGSQRS